MRGGTAQAATGVNQLGRIYRLAALITLVASSSRKSTVWTGALDIAVGQEALAMGTKRLRDCSLINIVSLKQGEKYVLCYLGVVGGAGSGK